MYRYVSSSWAASEVAKDEDEIPKNPHIDVVRVHLVLIVYRVSENNCPKERHYCPHVRKCEKRNVLS